MFHWIEQIKTWYLGLDGLSKVVIGLFGLAILISIAVYAIMRIRRYFYESPDKSMDDWASIEEMKESGTLRDYEYRHLRRKVAPKLTNDDGTDGDSEQVEISADSKPKS